MSKDERGRNSSFSEKPVRPRPRRLVDWINPTGAKKAHSLIDKVYKQKNLEMAWEKVKENRGSGGVDGQNLEAFEAQLDQQLGVSRLLCKRPGFVFGDGVQGKGVVSPSPAHLCRSLRVVIRRSSPERASAPATES